MSGELDLEYCREILNVLREQSYRNLHNIEDLKPIEVGRQRLAALVKAFEDGLEGIEDSLSYDPHTVCDNFPFLLGFLSIALKVFREYIVPDKKSAMLSLQVVSIISKRDLTGKESWLLDEGSLAQLKQSIEPLIAEFHKQIKDFCAYYSRILRIGLAGTVERFLSIADILCDSCEVQEFLQLVKDIYRRRNRSIVNAEYQANFPSEESSMVSSLFLFDSDAGKTPPMIFVCGSSGCGKTQLAFNISRVQPMIYLLDCRPSSAQPVYDPFIRLSNEFHDAVEQDMKDLILLDKYVGRLDFLIMKMRKKVLKSANFLLNLLEATIANYEILFKANLDECKPPSWLHALLNASLEPLESTSYTLDEVYLKISILMGESRLHSFLVFLDECNTADDGKYHVFKRNLVRYLGIVPVVMGEEFKFYNTVSHSSNSRGYVRPWCFVFAKLPAYSTFLLDEKISNIRASLETVENLTWRNELEEFLILLRKVCQDERPFFVDLAVDALLHFVTEEVNGMEDVDMEYVLNMLLKAIHGGFVKLNECKGNIGFFMGQFHFAQGRRGAIDLSRYGDAGSCLIHHFLGNMCNMKPGRENVIIEKSFMDTVCLTAETSEVENGYTKMSCFVQRSVSSVTEMYRPAVFFKSFHEQPLTSLAFSTSYMTYASPLHRPTFPDTHIQQVSVKQAYNDIISGKKVLPFTLPYRDGFYFESMMKMAIVLSLGRHGVKGMTAEKWLEWFVGELSTGVSQLYVPVHFESPECKKIFENIRLPFVGPVDQEWNADLLAYFQNKLDGFIGMLTGTRHGNDFNAVVQKYDGDRQAILTVLCKDHAAPFTESNILPALGMLLGHKVGLNILIVQKIGSMNTIKEYIEENPVQDVTIGENTEEEKIHVEQSQDFYDSGNESVTKSKRKAKIDDESKDLSQIKVKVDLSEVAIFYIEQMGTSGHIIKHLTGPLDHAQQVVLLLETDPLES